MKKVICCALAVCLLSGCAMTPEQRQAMARSMQNYHPYMLPPVQQQQAPQRTTTNCWTPSPGNVSCTSTTQ
jgi:uncharacterized lipoprotein